VLSHCNLDIGLGGNAQETLSNGDRFLFCIEPDFEYLLRSFELTDEPLELTVLLLTLARSGAQFTGPLAPFVHQRRVCLPDCDHLVPPSLSQNR